MPKLNSKTAPRGLATMAATALMVGGSFMPAAAAPEASQTPLETPSSTSTAPSTAASTDPTMPTEGLSEAVQRDLGKTVDEFKEDAKHSKQAAEIREKLGVEGIKATATVEDGKAQITVGEADEDRAKEIVESTAATSATVTAEVGTITDVNDVYAEVLKNVKPTELTRLTAIMNTSSGLQIIADGSAGAEKQESPATQDPTGLMSLTLEEFVEEADGVALVEGSGPAKTSAGDDFYGGTGYFVDPSGMPSPNMVICSTGFNAWSPSGEDAMLTAGHCALDGAGKIFGTMVQSAPDTLEGFAPPVGSFGFSQFGGINNSGISHGQLDQLTPQEQDHLKENTEPGTDIAVIEGIDRELNLPPAVTTWSAGGPGEDAMTVTGVSKAVAGSEVCASGRTTGWSCSKIFGEGLFFVAGYANDQRPVWGYGAANPGLSVVKVGDSGGPALAGSSAVGIASAYSAGLSDTDDDDLAFYTSLADVQAKGYIQGYQVKFFINAPELDAADSKPDVAPGAEITGTVQDASSGTEINIIVDGKVIDTVDVDFEGVFTFTAPREEGEFAFTLQAVNGLNISEETRASVEVVAPEPSPTPVEPTQDSAAPSASQDPGETNEPAESASPTASNATQGSVESIVEPAPEGSLADTGTSSMPLVVAGGILALVGCALLLRRGSRRHS